MDRPAPDRKDSAESKAHKVRLELQIDDVPYTVRFVHAGIRLTNRTTGSVYVVGTGADGPACNCPASTFRRRTSGECKHVLSLVAVGLINA